MIGRRRMTRHLLAAGAISLSLAATPALAAEKLTVFAAASLKNALDDVSAAWTADTGKEATMSYAASSALAKQIESGAPADVFISADRDWMDYLAANNLVASSTQVNLLGNTLVLVAPAGTKAAITIAPGVDIAGLLGGGRLALADVKAVPAGKYAKAALESLGVWHSVEGSIAQAENVRAALKLVATGEAPAGIVYQTDARSEPHVQVLGAFPASSHPPIIYPAAALASSVNPDAAAFIAFLHGKPARDIFTSYGFTVLGE